MTRPSLDRVNRSNRWIVVLLFVVLMVAAIGFRWSAVQGIKRRTPDERTYASYADAVVKSGPNVIRKLVRDYIESRDQWIYPPPTRVNYIYLVAAVEKISGQTPEKSAVTLSFVCSVLTFLVAAAIGFRFFNAWMALAGLALLAVSPVELALAGRGWQDAIVGAFGSLMLYLALERFVRPDGRWWDVWFWIVALLFLPIKESALIMFGICVLFLLLGRWQKGILCWKTFASIALSALLTVLVGCGFIAWCSGGLQNVFQLYGHMTEGLRSNSYVYLFQSGPWYAMPLGFWVLSPVSMLLCLLGVGQLFLRRERFERWLNLDPRQSAAASGMAFFLVAVLVAATVPQGYKCLRYVSVIDGPLCLIAGLMFAALIRLACEQVAPSRWKIAIGIGLAALLLVCSADLYRFRRVFIRDAIDDLAVVRLVNFVVTNDDIPFGLSRPYWEVEGKPAPTPTPETNEVKAQRLLQRSFALYKRGSYNEAIAAGRDALRQRPDYADAWNNIGAAYNQLGQYPDAVAAFREALRLRPNFGLAQRNLSDVEKKMRKPSAIP